MTSVGVRPPAAPAAVIRPLRWDDFEQLVGIYYEVYEERAQGVPIGIVLFPERPSRSDEVAWFSGLYRRVLAGEVLVHVAEVDGKVVGSCTIEPVGPLRQSETGHVGVLGILLDRSARGRGVGRSLLRRSLEAARSQFEQVRLAVFADNEAAVRLYRSLGFVRCGSIPRAIKRGSRYIDEELMILDLTRWPPPEPAAKG